MMEFYLPDAFLLNKYYFIENLHERSFSGYLLELLVVYTCFPSCSFIFPKAKVKSESYGNSKLISSCQFHVFHNQIFFILSKIVYCNIKILYFCAFPCLKSNPQKGQQSFCNSSFLIISCV